jgi:hypothetical protein
MKLPGRMTQRSVLELLFRMSARGGFYNLAAVLFRLTSRVVLRGPHQRGQSSYKIMMIPKDVFIEDVASSLGDCGEFVVYSAPRSVFKAVASAFLPPVVDDNFYVTDDPEIERCKQNYRKFLESMWGAFEKLLKIDGVITGNYSYYAERELATALEKRGVPFIALHKENMKSSGRVDFFLDVYRDRRGPFTGRRIVVYNEVERDVQVRAGVAAPQQITVCGMPRLDRMHQWRRRNAGRRQASGDGSQVMLFSFTARTGLPRMGRKIRAGFSSAGERLDESLERLSWSTLFRDTHRTFVRFARENPDVRVVIKTKPREREWGPVEEALGASSERPKNLRVVRGGNPFDLIAASDVVCGFNTTGLLEAVAAGIPVVVPWFGEVLDPEMQRYTIELGHAVEYATSAQNLLEQLYKYTSTPALISEELDADKLSALQYWCGNSDGEAGQRVYATVLEEVKKPVVVIPGASVDVDNA